MSVSESLGPEELSIAGSAMDLTVGSVASQGGVQRTMALGAVEALLVPHGSLGQLLLSGEHSATASWAALSLCGHNGGRIGVVEGPLSRDLVLAGKLQEP